jgi:hypothetical protein
MTSTSADEKRVFSRVVYRVKVGNSQFLDGRVTIVNPVEFLVFEGKGREGKERD